MPRTPEQIREYQIQYRAENAERLSAQRKAFRLENAESIKDQRRQYAEANREKILAAKREHYASNRESILAHQNSKRLNDLEGARESARQRYHKTKDANREKLRGYSRSRQKENNELKKIRNKERRKSDPVFLVIGRLRCRIRSAINGKGWQKNKSTGEMIGCSKEEFARHIESKFEPGMTWENRAKWHIDHIVPLSSASSVCELERLNHFANLRPMWAEENLRKGSKIECAQNSN
jgi:hypothetical protein